MRIMSFNIRYGTAPDGRNSWNFRKGAVVEAIGDLGPDLIGLQECRDDEQSLFIQANLPDYNFIGTQRGGSGDSAVEMTPILYRRNRFILENFGYFWLSTIPDLRGHKSWGAAFPRIAVWAALRDRQHAAQTFYFCNTHLDHASGQAIMEGGQLLLERLPLHAKGNPLILTGDFNTPRGGPLHMIMTDGDTRGSLRLKDTHPIDAPGTYHGFGRENNAQAIDWILVDERFRTQNAGIGEIRGSPYASDHAPLFADITWP
jgi:endonuclease/exonuclease/phosphatase family metal-dependent hydrolase